MITNKLLTQTLQEWSDTLPVDGQSGDTIITKEDLNRLSEKLIVIMHKIISKRNHGRQFKSFFTNLKSKISNLFVLNHPLHLLSSIYLSSSIPFTLWSLSVGGFILRSFSVGGLS